MNTTTLIPVLRGHLSDKEKVVFKDRWPLKRCSIHMKCSMTGQEKSDLLIQVTHQKKWPHDYTYMYIESNHLKSGNNSQNL